MLIWSSTRGRRKPQFPKLCVCLVTWIQFIFKAASVVTMFCIRLYMYNSKWHINNEYIFRILIAIFKSNTRHCFLWIQILLSYPFKWINHSLFNVKWDINISWKTPVRIIIFDRKCKDIFTNITTIKCWDYFKILEVYKQIYRNAVFMPIPSVWSTETDRQKHVY